MALGKTQFAALWPSLSWRRILHLCNKYLDADKIARGTEIGSTRSIFYKGHREI